HEGSGWFSLCLWGSFLLPLRQDDETADPLQIEPEERARPFLLPGAARDVELVHVRPAERHVARRQVAARVAAEQLALRTEHLDLPHAVMRYVQVPVRVEAHAVRLVVDLLALLLGEVGEDLQRPDLAGGQDVVSQDAIMLTLGYP